VATSPPRVAKLKKKRGGWEYPLSREEKKERVMYLYQAELAEAEHNSAQNFEALQALEKRSDIVGHVATGNVGKRWPFYLSVLGGCLAVVALLATLGVLLPLRQVKQLDGICAAKIAATESDLDVFMPQNLTVLPNISDRVLGMRREGHMRLELSNCAEAEWWFSLALRTISHDSNESEGVNHLQWLYGEHGFSLVCMQQFARGAKQLAHHISLADIAEIAPHLLNAMGYAYFHMEDFHRAGDFFHAGLQKGENPVLWNNLAAARMMHGDLAAADSAMFSAAESLKRLPVHQEHHTNLLYSNVQVLGAHSTGDVEMRPILELWNGYLDEPVSE
jgi:hypothetical protein